MTGLDGDAPFLVAINGSKAHKLIVAIKIIGAETGFSLNHALIHRGYIRHAGIRLSGFNHIGAAFHHGALPVADHIAFVVQDIGYAVIAHGQIDYNIRQEIGIDAAVNHTLKTTVDDDGNLQQEDHPLTVIHNVGNIGFHVFFALLEIFFFSVAVAGGG